jgi:hypothetical protein
MGTTHHPRHQGLQVTAADLAPLGSQQAFQHPRSCEGELQMQPIETAPGQTDVEHDRTLHVLFCKFQRFLGGRRIGAPHLTRKVAQNSGKTLIVLNDREDALGVRQHVAVVIDSLRRRYRSGGNGQCPLHDWIEMNALAGLAWGNGSRVL